MAANTSHARVDSGFLTAEASPLRKVWEELVGRCKRTLCMDTTDGMLVTDVATLASRQLQAQSELPCRYRRQQHESVQHR